MRKKIEELRNKEEGFTLVELLAVIVILGIIVAIAIPAIGNVTQRANTQADNAEQELIVDAARLYDIENAEEVSTNGGVSVSTLVSNGYLDLRAQGDEDVDAESRTDGVKVTRNEETGGSTYEYIETFPSGG